jgi:hypothetical protein
MEQNGPPPSQAQDLSLDAALASASAAVPSDSLEAVQLEKPLDESRGQPEIVIVRGKRNPWLMWTMVGLAVCLVVLGGIFLAKSRKGERAQLEAGHFGTISLPLKDIETSSTAAPAKSLQVNGALQVAGSVLLTPDTKPTSPQAGQLYYDKSAHQLGYYDGTGFVYMQGGAATYITNNDYSTSPINITNVTNTITNITNISGSDISGSGTAGHVAIFINGNTLGDSVITQSGSNLSVGSSSGTISVSGTSVAIDSGSGSSSVSAGTLTIASTGNSSITSGGSLTLQASTASSWGIATSSAAGNGLTIHGGNASGDNDGGALILQSGSGSGPSGVSGDITIDTQSSAISGTLLEDKSFEGSTENMTDWFSTTVTQSTAQAHTGTHSLSMVIASAGPWGVIQDNNFTPAPITAGHLYFFSAWVRAATVPKNICATITWKNGSGSFALNCVTDSVAGWIQMSGTTNAPPGATGSFWRFNGSGSVGEQHFFDNLVVVDLSAATSTADINIGASQAQKISIGNLNQVGPTTIQGGSGILINSAKSNLTMIGNIIAKPQTDSIVAFEIQNSSGLDLLAADTTNMNIIIKSLIVSSNITINGHIITGGTAPTVAAGAAACTTPTVSVAGTDTSGTVTVATGTGCAASGILATLTFASAFGAAPHVTLTPGDAGSLALGAYVQNSTVSTTSFQLGASATPANSTVYQWNYLIVQ